MRLEQEIDALNFAQKEAVIHLGAPLLILAGPGSGKTRVITLKIAWLIKELQSRPNSILAMTFTNKAAREMKERVKLFLQEESIAENYRNFNMPYISTFHSCGVYLLRRYYEKAQLNKNFQIYDTNDQLTLLQEANPRLSKDKLRGILTGISRAKDYGVTASASEEALGNYMEDTIYYKNYERLKSFTGNVDFGDLLIKPFQLMKFHEDIKSDIKNMWHWFFVDEYQDTNYIQSQWLNELCHNTANIVVVGDDDQSIYGFRGALIDNILRFEQDFAHTKIVHLVQNYRSTPQIVMLASQLIQHNNERHGKTITSDNPEGTKPQIVYFKYDTDEEQYVVEQARQAQHEGKHLAVFYRVNSQSRGYEMALRKAHIEYELIGTVGFFGRTEIKDAIALLRIYKNPHDIVSFLRIANKPARGLGKTSRQHISEQMKAGKSWKEARNILEGLLSKKSIVGLLQLEQVLGSSLHDGEDTHIGTVLRLLLEKSGLWKFFEKEDEETPTERISNLEELISYSMDFINTEAAWDTFFEQIALNEGGGQASSQKMVQLITLHRSKGLEFDRVIICGLEENRIPLTRKTDESDIDIEEERRLLYVGITRAKQTLSLTCCQNRKRYGRLEQTYPSQFLLCFDNSTVVWLNSDTLVEGETPVLDWNVGDRVYHKDYGLGYVFKVLFKNKQIVVHVEFDNEFIATLIPKFESLEKIY